MIALINLFIPSEKSNPPSDVTNDSKELTRPELLALTSYYFGDLARICRGLDDCLREANEEETNYYITGELYGEINTSRGVFDCKYIYSAIGILQLETPDGEKVIFDKNGGEIIAITIPDVFDVVDGVAYQYSESIIKKALGCCE